MNIKHPYHGLLVFNSVFVIINALFVLFGSNNTGIRAFSLFAACFSAFFVGHYYSKINQPNSRS